LGLWRVKGKQNSIPIKLAEASKKGTGNWQYLGLTVIGAEVVRINLGK